MMLLRPLAASVLALGLASCNRQDLGATAPEVSGQVAIAPRLMSTMAVPSVAKMRFTLEEASKAAKVTEVNYVQGGKVQVGSVASGASYKLTALGFDTAAGAELPRFWGSASGTAGSDSSAYVNVALTNAPSDPSGSVTPDSLKVGAKLPLEEGMWYTEDGSDPRVSGKEANGPIEISKAGTVKVATKKAAEASKGTPALWSGVTSWTFTAPGAAIVAHDSTLSGLTVDNGTLVPSFAKSRQDYVDTVDYAVATVTVQGTTSDVTNTIRYATDGTTYGTSGSVSLVAGEVKTVSVKVDNLNGKSLVYTVAIYRKPQGAKPKYTLTTVAPNGSISLNPSGGSYDSGASVTATATANSGYAFSGWSGACANVSGTCTVEMDGNKTLAATFTATASSQVATPTFSLREGTYTGTQRDTLKTTTSGAKIYYTVDGTDPTTKSTLYTDPILVGTSQTVKAIAVKVGMDSSSVASATYTINRTKLTGSGTLTDDRDGQEYKCVKIGSQIWMAQNLNYKGRGADSGWAFNNSPDSASKYGRLYTWSMAMGLASACNTGICSTQVSLPRQGACPFGWHVPSDAEWSALQTATGVSGTADATKLKSVSGWKDYNGAVGGTDSLGFNALPAGLRATAGDFNWTGSAGYWWSASELNATNSWNRIMSNAAPAVIRNSPGFEKLFGISLRCVQD